MVDIPHSALVQLSSVPILLLIRRQLCDFVLSEGTSAYNLVCNDNVLENILGLLAPWKKIFAIGPMGGWSWEASPDAIIVLLCALLLTFLITLVKFVGPRITIAYISPAQGLPELMLRIISMFMRSCFGIVYLFLYRQYYHGEKHEPLCHKFAMQALCSHYAIRGLEALLLRRYSSPFFPPSLNTVGQLLGTLSAYLFHYFVVIAHFHFAARADYGGEEELKVTWMTTYLGYGVALLGQILMLKNSDLIPGSSGGSASRGCMMSWVGIALISQHCGIWAIVLALWPFAHCEELVEVWTGQRYGLVMLPLRTRKTVYCKDAPGLGTDVLPALVEQATQWGELKEIVVRPRATADSSDIHMVFDCSLAAGMAASNMDGSIVEGWKVRATQRTPG